MFVSVCFGDRLLMYSGPLIYRIMSFHSSLECVAVLVVSDILSSRFQGVKEKQILFLDSVTLEDEGSGFLQNVGNH
jgi:hypothetical protein